MIFSDRMGITQPRTLLQKDDMDDDLRNMLWEVLLDNVLSVDVVPKFEKIYERIFVKIFKLPTDQLDYYAHENLKMVRKLFFSVNWYDVYNIIESFVAVFDLASEDIFNPVLKEEKSAYRFVDHKLVPITDDIALEEIELVLNSTDKFLGARKHISNALEAFSKKPDADYIGTVRESIHAVESCAKVLLGNENTTLGKALKELEKIKPMHPSFKGALDKLYGYTSDEKGLRHALLDEEANIDEADAHFMIVACSAFINFAISRYADKTN